ncbi:MAG TPA: hypothetical protein VGI42_00510 [Chthoniobacterales bacterium]|jgi:p-aminobenzoyl-glutamate transporter AbgT
MKMEKKEDFETFDEQEKRARRRLRTKALVKAALLAGLVVFILPAGGPWMSTEAFTAVMGRIMAKNPIVDLVAHFILAMAYGWVVGACIYSLPTAAGIIFGTLLGVPLYGLNYVICGFLAGYPANELHAVIAHLVFCLFFSVAYRAMAISSPRRKVA